MHFFTKRAQRYKKILTYTSGNEQILRVLTNNAARMDCVKNCDILKNLFIAFGAVVGLTKHLAVGDVGSTTFRPSGNMVGVHFG
jgi:hypothetical protein